MAAAATMEVVTTEDITQDMAVDIILDMGLDMEVVAEEEVEAEVAADLAEDLAEDLEEDTEAAAEAEVEVEAATVQVMATAPIMVVTYNRAMVVVAEGAAATMAMVAPLLQLQLPRQLQQLLIRAATGKPYIILMISEFFILNIFHFVL